VLIGTTEASVDDKGRLALPKRFRTALPADDARLILTAAPDGCLALYPYAKWEEVAAQFLSLSNLEEHARWWQRLMIGHAEEHTLDGSDRLLIPPELRELAGITKQVLLIGQMTRIEIWEPSSYRSMATVKRQTTFSKPPPGGEKFTL
jgi:MraZ protein